MQKKRLTNIRDESLTDRRVNTLLSLYHMNFYIFYKKKVERLKLA